VKLVSQQKLHTILVVEDVEEISSRMKAALNQRGHEVMLASNAEQALQISEQSRPAMILTDLELPTFDKLMNLLRAHKDLNKMVVAILDINDPKVEDKSVNVLRDFETLDDLIQSSQTSD
jgi:sigma-B regulation protein RsbU (phosphoserine phosphatase)